MAHIERYEALRKREAVSNLAQMGAVIQVNASSFCDRKQRKYLLNLAKADLIHVIGSDCHDLEKRPPGIRCGTEILKKALPADQYQKICFTNPAHILKGEYINV